MLIVQMFYAYDAAYPGNVCRYFIRKDHPVYGYWFYYMWENVVGPALEDINPALNPKNSDQVDELLAAEISLYVQLHA